MRVMVNKDGHRCNGMSGSAEPAYTGKDLSLAWKNVMVVVMDRGNHGIKSIKIDKQYLITL